MNYTYSYILRPSSRRQRKTMPKIEVNEKLFFNLLDKKYDYDNYLKKHKCRLVGDINGSK